MILVNFRFALHHLRAHLLRTLLYHFMLMDIISLFVFFSPIFLLEINWLRHVENVNIFKEVPVIYFPFYGASAINLEPFFGSLPSLRPS